MVRYEVHRRPIVPPAPVLVLTPPTALIKGLTGRKRRLITPSLESQLRNKVDEVRYRFSQKLRPYSGHPKDK